jgi:hypothetical protein
LWGNLQEKCQTLISGPLFCASLRNGNAHGHFTKAILVWKFTGKVPDATDTTSIKHRALTLTVRTLQYGYTVWETKKDFAQEIGSLSFLFG